MMSTCSNCRCSVLNGCDVYAWHIQEWTSILATLLGSRPMTELRLDPNSNSALEPANFDWSQCRRAAWRNQSSLRTQKARSSLIATTTPGKDLTATSRGLLISPGYWIYGDGMTMALNHCHHLGYGRQQGSDHHAPVTWKGPIITMSKSQVI